MTLSQMVSCRKPGPPGASATHNTRRLVDRCANLHLQVARLRQILKWNCPDQALYNAVSMSVTDHDFLQAALAGYKHHLDEINQRIIELRARLGNTADGAAAAPLRRTMTLVARRKIAAAQKKRWAAVKSMKAKPETSKRKVSAAARKRIGDAARKRWALLKAKQKVKPAK